MRDASLRLRTEDDEFITNGLLLCLRVHALYSWLVFHDSLVYELMTEADAGKRPSERIEKSKSGTAVHRSTFYDTGESLTGYCVLGKGCFSSISKL
jgi:hypothetical protein